MALDAKKVFAISKDDDKSLATGFKRAYSNGDGTYTVEFIDGSTVVSNFIKGDKGDKGDKFEFSDFTPDEIESLKVKGDQGEKGDKGNGVIANTKTGTTGLVDTYTMVYDDGTTSTYDVINGANITKLSELENDENFIKATTMALINYYMRDEVYSKAQIDELLRNLGAGISLDIVDVLPTENISPTTIYLLSTGGSNFNQYIYVNNEWRGIGSTSVDMTNYYTKAQIDNKLEDYCTLVRLTNKLDDYMLKANVSKVGKSNDYNDLDNLPEIPDVSGIKPYVSILQDSEETAPTSKVVYDAVQEINTALEDKADKTDLVEIDDTSTTAEDKVWSAKKVNDSLVDIESALDDKADVSELAGLKRRYNTIEELNAIKKKSLILVNGEDNTQKVLDALDDGEVLSDYFSNGGSTSRFGIDNSLGPYFIITFEKNGSGYAKVTAKSTTSNTVLVRYHNANELSAWQELATMDKVVPYVYLRGGTTKTLSQINSVLGNEKDGSFMIIYTNGANNPEHYCMALFVQRYASEALNIISKNGLDLSYNASTKTITMIGATNDDYNSLTITPIFTWY